jgi:hypothetical protein
MEQVFAFLYPLVALISGAAYLPQIVSLWKLENRAEDISLSSWCIWLASALISFGYGIFCLKDPRFCLVAALSVVMISLVVGLIMHNRYVRFGQAT